jgi:hypothetical protein
LRTLWRQSRTVSSSGLKSRVTFCHNLLQIELPTYSAAGSDNIRPLSRVTRLGDNRPMGYWFLWAGFRKLKKWFQFYCYFFRL